MASIQSTDRLSKLALVASDMAYSVNTLFPSLIGEMSIDRFVVGIVRNIAVSSSGCKVALSLAIHWKAHYDGLGNLQKGGPGYTTLKVVDLFGVMNGAGRSA